jgi:nucleoid-associated protein YgaU
LNYFCFGVLTQPVDKADGVTYDFEQAEYKVKPNDTFETIAIARWGDIRLAGLIARANGMKVGDSLNAGRKLTIPAREDSINTSYQTLQSGSSAQSMYVVKSADETFESIAKMQWGDSSLWYLIADANRMGATDGLTEGQLLIIPAKGAATHNNINSFKPYSPNEAIGDLTPKRTFLRNY